jgi:outer membrane protein OmpA-like peptidoglycan-associated protein
MIRPSILMLVPALVAACATTSGPPESILPETPAGASGGPATSAVFGQKAADALGLRGEIYELPEHTSKLPDFDKLKPIGAVYATTLNMPERDFKDGFPGVTDRFEWFAIDYHGTFLAPAQAKYKFQLASDDGSILAIDGKTVIDNDGVHPTVTKEGEVDLQAGAHSIRVEYFQGPRYGIALVLKVGVAEDPLRVFDAHVASPLHAACGAGKLRLTLDGGVLFDVDRDSLQPGTDVLLAQIKNSTVDAFPAAKVVVEGHTDNVGSDAHNDDLSSRRAKTVVGWLTGHGVDLGRLQARGYGKHWPRYPNTDEAGRAKNRRVEIVVLDPSAATSPACNGAGAT